MNQLIQATRYPWQSQHALRRLLPLALLQLIPVVGQIILIGYGQEVARAVSKQQADLPVLRIGQTLLDGLKMAGAGIIYCFPIFITVLLAFTTTSTPSTESANGAPAAILPVVMILLMGGSSLILKKRPSLQPLFNQLGRLFGIGIIFFIIWRLRSIFAQFEGGFELSPPTLNPATLGMLTISALLFAFIIVAFHVIGVRFALTGEGLLDPSGVLKIMAKHRHLTINLIATIWLLLIATIILTTIGAFFLILPGLILLVTMTLSIWYVAAKYHLNLDTDLATSFG